jgi:hypothetical protein
MQFRRTFGKGLLWSDDSRDVDDSRRNKHSADTHSAFFPRKVQGIETNSH